VLQIAPVIHERWPTRKPDAEVRRTLDNLPVLSWRGLPDGSKTSSTFDGTSTPASRPRKHTLSWYVTDNPEDVTAVENVGWRLVCVGAAGRSRHVCGDSTVSNRWFLGRAQPVRDQLGNIIMWYGTDTRIEDRKATETSCGEASKSFRRSSTSSPDIAVLDPAATSSA